MLKDKLKEIIVGFQTSPLPLVKPRQLNLPLNLGKTITLTGVRRSGKTYLLFETINKLRRQGIPPQNILYLNFEDERLEINQLQPDLILQAYQELYPNLPLQNCYFFFDEVQLLPGWEQFARRLTETVSKNIFLTGSNAKLLSQEIATSLRGRTLTYTLFPLNFKEYLYFRGFTPAISFALKSRAQIIHQFTQFLQTGGFPELLFLPKEAKNEIKDKILQEYFNVMLFRDLVERYQITQTAILKYFCKRLIANSANEFSVHKIYQELKSQGYKISKDTLYQFQNASEAIFLSLLLNKFDYSVVKTESAQKKAYVIDIGLGQAIDFKLSQDKGRLLENLVFLELIKADRQVFYYQNRHECDFLIQNKKQITTAVQVCLETSDQSAAKRELTGLLEACKIFHLKKGYILTLENKERLSMAGVQIEILPVYEYLLNYL